LLTRTPSGLEQEKEALEKLKMIGKRLAQQGAKQQATA
jgi:hypothetical protein